MSDKIVISELPVTGEFLPERRLIQERGELALIVDGSPFRHLAYFSLVPGPHFRGGHYHRVKTEFFYVIAGKARLSIHDLDSGEKAVHLLAAGGKVTIFPGLAHRFVAEEETRVIEYYDAVYDKRDDYPFSDF
ncbi:MAG: cupin domain-containing protein [Desulfovibrionaceae bacterium]|nr:cupin domain-containing protein [Desulfovibrionaceae bacterium]MBF0513280.1 cupin domain-containing protein [Desulfovibrionaceae bacterium]